MLIGASRDCFSGMFRDFGVRGNYAGITLQIGHESYADPLNSFIFDGLIANNKCTLSSACAVELNYVLNGQIYMIANAGRARRFTTGCR
jgi:hypothetical protein